MLISKFELDFKSLLETFEPDFVALGLYTQSFADQISAKALVCIFQEQFHDLTCNFLKC